ncbi:MAG: 50S ribosomal protein L18 [Bdellovibrionales bacterium]|nr:50S ribosomal protein L18 [Bdellovibrionales bacterium]
MRLTINKKNSHKLKSRKVKKVRSRKKINGTDERPRLCVFRSLKNIYVQLVNDIDGTTIASASSLVDVKDKKAGKDLAFEVGKVIAQKAKAKNIDKVVFDRGGYIYHGRVKSVADGAREGGLNF